MYARKGSTAGAAGRAAAGRAGARGTGGATGRRGRASASGDGWELCVSVSFAFNTFEMRGVVLAVYFLHTLYRARPAPPLTILSTILGFLPVQPGFFWHSLRLIQSVRPRV